MKGKKDGIRLEILANDSVASIGDFADFHLATDADWMDLFAASDTCLDGSDDSYDEMDALSSEEDILGSSGPTEALDEREEFGFSITFESAQETEKGVMPREILEMEDPTLQWTALSIYEAVHVLYKTLKSPVDSHEVANWLFADKPTQDSHEVTFEDCCRAHNARPVVIRMRVMFELWRFGKYTPEPFNFDSYDIPNFISSALVIEHGFHAQRMAELMWRFPGATHTQLAAYASKEELATIPMLAQKYYASASVDNGSGNEPRWYLTGVNPILKSEDQIRPTLNKQKRIELSWSRHFPVY